MGECKYVRKKDEKLRKNVKSSSLARVWLEFEFMQPRAISARGICRRAWLEQKGWSLALKLLSSSQTLFYLKPGKEQDWRRLEEMGGRWGRWEGMGITIKIAVDT